MQHPPPAPPKQNFNLVTFDTLSRTKRPGDQNSCVICTNADGSHTTRSWMHPEDGDSHDYSFNELMLTSDIASYTQTATLLRNAFGVDVTQTFAMHHSIDILCIANAFNYAVFKNYEYMTNITLENIKSLHEIIKSLYQRANCVHGNICPMLIGKTLKEGKPVIRPPLSLIHVSRTMSRQEKLNIMVPIIVTPLHVMIDMLSSTFEKEKIEYFEFRQKFMRYWEHVLPNGLKQQVPQWLSKTFSAIAGCSDYIDFAINRYCLIERNADDGKQYVLKNPSKALGYLFDIDVIGLCISTYLMQRPINTQPPLDVVQYLGFMIRGDIPTVVNNELPPIALPAQPAPATASPTLPPPSSTSPSNSNDEKKIMYKGQMRLVRSDDKGDYILWQKQKIYI